MQAACPECGLMRTMTREEYLIFFKLPHRRNALEEKIIERGGVSAPVCPGCGADMTGAFDKAVTPAVCKGNHIICGYPCGRKDDPYRAGSRPCATMVPLGKPDEGPGAT